MAGMRRVIPTVPMMAIIVVAVLMAAAVTRVVARDSSGNPSSLTSWSQLGCNGYSSTIGACGCTDLVLVGGQQFYYRGETGTLYSGTGCSGTPLQMSEDFPACEYFGDLNWHSIKIDC